MTRPDPSVGVLTPEMEASAERMLFAYREGTISGALAREHLPGVLRAYMTELARLRSALEEIGCSQPWEPCHSTAMELGRWCPVCRALHPASPGDTDE